MKSKSKFYDPSRDGITQGLLGTWLECRQKARYFLQGYSSKGTPMAMTYGTVGHGVLQYAYEDFRTGKITGIPSRKRVVGYVSEVEKIWRKENERPSKQMIEDLETSLAFAEVILPEYFKYWSTDFTKKKWKKVEGSFKIPYKLKDGRKTFLRGKMDGVFESPGLWLFESKFKSMINEGDLVDTLTLDLQVKIYLWALYKTYKQIPKGVLYNVVRRFNQTRRVSETLKEFCQRCREDLEKRPDWYFFRFEVCTSPSDIREFEAELENMLTDFMDWWEGKSPHYRNPGSCITKYGRCWGLNACANSDYGNLTKRKTMYRELEDL